MHVDTTQRVRDRAAFCDEPGWECVAKSCYSSSRTLLSVKRTASIFIWIETGMKSCRMDILFLSDVAFSSSYLHCQHECGKQLQWYWWKSLNLMSSLYFKFEEQMFIVCKLHVWGSNGMMVHQLEEWWFSPWLLQSTCPRGLDSAVLYDVNVPFWIYDTKKRNKNITEYSMFLCFFIKYILYWKSRELFKWKI